MDYKNHFLKEHIPKAEKEIACIIDLCGRIALSVKKLNIDEANRYKEDLLNSLSEVTDLYKLQQRQAESKAEETRRMF